MNAEEIARAAILIDRLLARHGYLQSRASEVVLCQPCKDARLPGDHARYMCERVLHYLRTGDVQRALRWLRFVQGVVWTLGVRSLEELRHWEEGEEE